MAKLDIEARGARTTADPGDRDRAVVVVSVADTGRPVTTLTAANFFVQAIIVGAGGPGVTISGVTSRAEGVYTIDVIPSTPAATWRPGHYILAVSVVRGFDRGQCLAEVTIT